MTEKTTITKVRGKRKKQEHKSEFGEDLGEDADKEEVEKGR